MAGTNSYVQVPPDGSGKRVYSKEHSVGGNTVQVQGYHISDKNDPSIVASVDDKGALYTRYAEGAPLLAPYGDLKILQEHIIGVYEHSVDSYDDLFYIQERSGGTSTYDKDTSSIIMTVTEDRYSKVERISNRYHYYQPGTSMLIIITVSMGDSGTISNTRRWGYADDDNGFLFELSGTTLNIMQRGTPQGVGIHNAEYIRIPQSSWNIDKLDGTGSSGVNLDVTKSYQYYINIAYPSGKVEYGIYTSSGRINCHTSSSDGTLSYPYVSNATLPLYFENENHGEAPSSSSMRIIGSVVKSENYPDYTFWRYGDLGTGYFGGTGKTVTSNETPVITLKPKILLDNGVRNTVNCYPETLSVYSSSEPIRIKMIWCGDDIFTGATWLCDSIDGPLLADIDATEIDVDADSYWNTETFYINANEVKNINLDRFFELNDEGVLLSGDGLTQNALSFTAQSLNGNSTIVSMDISYKGLY